MKQVTKRKNKTNKFNFSSLLLGKLTRNGCFLLLLICILLFLLYLIGNFQSFTDITQLRILAFLSVFSSALSIMSILAFVLELVLVFMKKKKAGSMLSMFFFLFTFACGGALIALSAIIRRIAQGI